MADLAKIQARIDQLGETYLKASPADRQRLVLEFIKLKEAKENQNGSGG